jgi:hypothetical protein
LRSCVARQVQALTPQQSGAVTAGRRASLKVQTESGSGALHNCRESPFANVCEMFRPFDSSDSNNAASVSTHYLKVAVALQWLMTCRCGHKDATTCVVIAVRHPYFDTFGTLYNSHSICCNIGKGSRYTKNSSSLLPTRRTRRRTCQSSSGEVVRTRYFVSTLPQYTD